MNDSIITQLRRTMHRWAAAGAAFAIILNVLPAAAQPSGAPSADTKSLVAGVNGFGFALFDSLGRGRQANVCISPTSISTAFALAMNGARGETRREMAATFGIADMSPDRVNGAVGELAESLTAPGSDVTVEMANALWYNDGICRVKRAFLETNRASLGAELLPLTTSDAVNAWVGTKTHGKIPVIIPYPLADNTVTVLVNAVYFKGAWLTRFDSNATRVEDFRDEENTTSKCHMMHMTAPLSYYQDERMQAVDLPYAGGRFAMTIVLPHPGRTIDSLGAVLRSDGWSNLTARMYPANVDLSMPRFTTEYDASLVAPLQRLGMRLPFGGADFGDICDTDLVITDVLHRTFVDVQEEGTEAAAATAIVIAVDESTMGSEERLPIPIRLDRPFVYAIRDMRTGAILFLGKVHHPTVAG